MGAMTFDSEGGEWWEVAALALKEMSVVNPTPHPRPTHLLIKCFAHACTPASCIPKIVSYAASPAR